MGEVVSMEESKGEWGFKAHKQMVKLQFKQKNYKEMMVAYKEMLTYIKSAVTRNYSEKVINKVLDLVSGSQQMELLREFYKMHMGEREWEMARNDFFEAFKNYDEAGVQRRVQCLKYLVMSTMLTNSDINPFDSQEAKPYKNDPEIIAMTNLVAAYMHNEIREFEKIIKQNARTVMGDPFIKLYIEDLLKNIRTQVLLKVI